MQVTLLRRWEEVLALGPEWQELEDRGGAPTVFQTFAWQSAWIRHLRKGRPWTLCFREGSELVGLAPLHVARAYGSPLRRLHFLATGASDYLDLLALPGRRVGVTRAFYAYLGAARPEWDLADLHQVRSDSPLLTSLPTADARTDALLAWSSAPQAVAPYCPLPGSREEFLKGLGKKTRGNLGYSRRVLEREHSVELGQADAGSLEAEMAAFFRLHQARWRRRWMPGQMAGARTRAFHLDAARGLLARGRLRLHYLRLDGRTVASLYCFTHQGTCSYYLSGFEPGLARFGVGTLLTAEAILAAIDEGCAEFDFLRGQEGYKYRWGCRDRRNYRLIARGGGVRSWAAGEVARLEQRVADWYEARAHAGRGGTRSGPERSTS